VKILYVEDEPSLGRIVKESLEKNGFEIKWLEDGAKVLTTFNSYVPDICVMDVMLPYVDGFTLGEEIRKRFPKLPIIFLTAKSQQEDVLKGFTMGGTDYIRKPFSIEELIARINSQLNMSSHSSSLNNIKNNPEVFIGKYVFYPHLYQLKIGKNIIKLSLREAQILQIFSSNMNGSIDRKELLLSIWNDDSFYNSRNLDVYIRKLREYLSKDPAIEIITLKGKGYQFVIK